ncbi:hypothetical protein H6F75_05460 [Nodosilinea sp. FACHB-131]|uniref:hypothetical protein n=1 Tax=Cyanophyceae TaxID=3028117 RepID=UPI001682D88C|nr:hypothetical protein [Nodosilinea sp. FACHB-131]MBD1872920.1 hypothetical protein [Nodosilinea sp. FACHB-131]
MIRPVYSLLGASAIFAALGMTGAVAAREPVANQTDRLLPSPSVASRLAQSFPVIEFPPGEGVREGTFAGTGVATGSKFTVGRQAEAMLNFNTSNNFSLSLAATGADTLEMLYQGTVTRQSASALGTNGFVLETRVSSFASSLGDWQVFEASGTCRIEVFDSQVVSSTCNVTAPAFPTDLTGLGLSSEFRGVGVSTPVGAFPGRGVATGSKFAIGRQADAMLNVNDNNFSISIAATAANNLEMLYQGTVTRRSAGRQAANSFVLETRVNSFVSSLGDWQVFEASGTCRIEVFDALVVSSICNVTAPAFPTDLTVLGLSTEFRGMDQF